MPCCDPLTKGWAQEGNCLVQHHKIMIFGRSFMSRSAVKGIRMVGYSIVTVAVSRMEMSMKKFGLVLGVVVLLLSKVAAADVSRALCLADANKARTAAVASARETFENAVSACRGPCFESCRSTWQSCVAPFRSTREQCVASAEGVFAAAVASCKTTVGCTTRCFTNRDFQLCLVDPRVTRRTAVNSCYSTESQGIKGAGCNAALKSCKSACKSSAGS